MLTNLRNKLRCLWFGHSVRRIIWPGFERDWKVPRMYKCRVCGKVEIEFFR